MSANILYCQIMFLQNWFRIHLIPNLELRNLDDAIAQYAVIKCGKGFALLCFCLLVVFHRGPILPIPISAASVTLGQSHVYLNASGGKATQIGNTNRHRSISPICLGASYLLWYTTFTNTIQREARAYFRCFINHVTWSIYHMYH